MTKDVKAVKLKNKNGVRKVEREFKVKHFEERWRKWRGVKGVGGGWRGVKQRRGWKGEELNGVTVTEGASEPVWKRGGQSGERGGVHVEHKRQRDTSASLTGRQCLSASFSLWRRPFSSPVSLHASSLPFTFLWKPSPAARFLVFHAWPPQRFTSPSPPWFNRMAPLPWTCCRSGALVCRIPFTGVFWQ